MRPIASRSIAAVLAGALTLGLLPTGAAQAAGPKSPIVKPAAASDAVTDFSARRRHYHRGHGGAAALAAFGMIAGTIATIAAEERRRDYYDRYGYYGYAPPPPPPPYYGYGYRGYRYW